MNSWIKILPPREDVAFHRAGFSGITTIDNEEQSRGAFEARDFQVRLGTLRSVADATPIIDRLKWLRVTDVVWRADAVPGIPLGALGDVRTVTNGVALHLNGPTMTRGLRQVSLTVVPADLQGHSETILPIGFSPFLHCWSLDQPGHEIPLANTGGYATIQRALPVGAELLFKAITPAWQSLVTWFSMAASVLGGIALLASGSGRSLPWPGTTKASTDSGEMTPGRNGTKLRPI